MTANIFRSAVNKLTIWYVGALFIVCLLFSIPMYTAAANQLQRSAEHQADIIDEMSGPFPNSFLKQLKVLRQEQLQTDRQELLQSIVFADGVILILGAYLSYQFAHRTLRPIEEAHESQARFATDASHELRTPLATMQAEIEVALRDKKMNTAGAKDVMASNLEEIARLRNLSEQLLGLTQVNDKKIQHKEVALGQIASDEIRHQQKLHGLKIPSQIAKNLTVRGDEQLLRQLFSILIDNGIKYAGDNPPKMNVSLEKSDKQIVCKITDHGIGIKPTDLPFLFDRFYRGTQAAKYNASGHGLGLSLAKQITEAHGGTIQASSKKHGTTFEITLPTV